MQKTIKQPHDNWATFYDFVYEKTFGDFYNNLTVQTLKAIKDILPNGKIIDYGAGTGRLTIPLKKDGYNTIAVEKSLGMVEELKNKCKVLNLDLPIHNCSISEYNNENADMAMALFTVLSYSINEDQLTSSINNICKHLSPNAFFFFDLPNDFFFNTGRLIDVQSKDFNRSVEIISTNTNDLYIYKEICSGFYNDQKFSYEDEFQIKYWELAILDSLLVKNGLKQIDKDFSQFNSTGSTYKLYQKII